MINHWPLNELGLTNSIVDAYINESEKIRPFYNHKPDVVGIKEATEAKGKQFTITQRKKIVHILNEQLDAIDNGEIDLSQSRKNIQSLLKPQTFSVTTGQQLHPFLGPGYFINKIFTCIKTAQFYNKTYKSSQLVPIFWLASEDHDIDEIGDVKLFNETYTVEFEKGIITGEQSTKHLLPIINKLEERLGEEAEGAAFYQTCKKAYLNQPTLSKATAYIIYSLFAEFGIIVLDANNKELKKEMEHVFRSEIEDLTTTKIQKKMKKEFKALQFHFQVMPRGNNLFTISNDNKRSICQDITFQPGHQYSPNALLRPLYQEIIFLNISLKKP